MRQYNTRDYLNSVAWANHYYHQLRITILMCKTLCKRWIVCKLIESNEHINIILHLKYIVQATGEIILRGTSPYTKHTLFCETRFDQNGKIEILDIHSAKLI